MPDDPTHLTPAARQTLKRLCEEATPGPWQLEGAENIHGAPVVRDSHPDGWVARLWKSHPNKITNGQFIAASRSALPALLDALERVETENVRLRDTLARISLFQEIYEGQPGLWFCRLCGANGFYLPMTHRRDCLLAPQANGEDAGGQGAE